jgi:hypothetical protein
MPHFSFPAAVFWDVLVVRCLSIHADYACRHSGACCRAGWRIPVGQATGRTLRDAIASQCLPAGAGACESDGQLTVLALKHDGTCTAFEPAHDGRPHLCAIHRALGHESLPTACRMFPRVSLTDTRGRFVTLSHFCPTAAHLLFRTDIPLAIVEVSAGSRMAADHEGFDAREALPPLLRPGLLMDVESYGLWEAHAIEVLADDSRSPESALSRLAGEVESLRAWTPGAGTLARQVAAIGGIPCNSGLRYMEAAAGIEEVLESVPGELRPAALPVNAAAIDQGLVGPGWVSFGRPLRYYLAARLLGAWVAYQGRGLRTVMRYLAVALAAVRHEAIKVCAADEGPLDRERLVEAIRAADDLLVHRADSLALARRLSSVEGGPGPREHGSTRVSSRRSRE